MITATKEKATGSITDFFPFAEFRPYQKDALLRIERAFTAGKRFVIVEAPTGSGKSGIAIAAARCFGEAYLVTPQKVLQQQYLGDFGDHLVNITGKSNYECRQDILRLSSCNEGACRITKVKCPDCPYEVARDKAIDGPITLTNFAYYATAICRSNKFARRKLLVIDEGHNVERVLMNHVSISVSQRGLMRAGIDLKLPEHDEVGEYVDWLLQLRRTVAARADDFTGEAQAEKDGKERHRKLRQADQLEKLALRIAENVYLFRTTRWIVDRTVDKEGFVKLEFKPVQVDCFAEDKIFSKGEKVLIMSATILDWRTYCRSLGINTREVEYIAIPSTFPVSNRPIYATNSGKMAVSCIDRALPRVAQQVNKLLEHHAGEKGIIHCQSYKIQQFILQHCNSSGRLLAHDSWDREMKLREHLESDAPTVLLSPSMTEGIDLKDGLSRFQIIVKLPYPYLGDKQIATRKDIDPQWYTLQAALSLVQAYGRSVRSAEDKAVTYVMDSGFRYFVLRYGYQLPEWFKEAIVWS